MQQFATTLGIMGAYWIGYGTNYIGGNGDSQHELAWRLPLIIQGIPAIILAVGVWFLPFSPRLLVKHGRDEEALQSLSRLRRLPLDEPLIRIEYLEIKAESEFEKRVFEKRFPQLAVKAKGNRLLRELAQYSSIFRTKDSFKRVAIGGTVMFFQQWSGTLSYTLPCSVEVALNHCLALKPRSTDKPMLNTSRDSRIRFILEKRN